MEGSTCGLITQPPNDDEIHEYQMIVLSDGFDWVPSKNLFEISLLEDSYRTTSNFHRYINISDRIVTGAPTNIQCIYDFGIYAFDR